MIINIAVAITENGGIGLKGGLPWPHLKTDMALFSKRTTGSGKNAVLMGKNTWYSIPENRRPLKNRTNIIITRNQMEPMSPSSCHAFHSIHDAVTFCDKCGDYDELWIIGGSGIYNEVLNTHYDKVNRVYITYVCGNYECDTFIHIPAESYLIEEKTYNPAENCYYLTCVHKMHANDGKGRRLELLEVFIKDSCYQEHDSSNLRIDS
jgi:dihydrofolate reductase